MANTFVLNLSGPLCRFCLKTDNCAKIFYENLTFNRRLDKLIDFLLTKVDEFDGLPNWICDRCIANIENVVEFEAQCDMAYRVFREKVLEQQKSTLQACATAELVTQDVDPSPVPSSEETIESPLMLVELEDIKPVDLLPRETHGIMEPDTDDVMEKAKQAELQRAMNVKPLELIKGRTKTIPLMPCIFCNKHYRGRNALKTHLYLHLDIRCYSCKHCNQTFNSLTSRDYHEARHMSTKPFECADCGQRFYSRRELTQHRRNRHDERQIQCDHCTRRFTSRHQLEDHLTTHSASREHECEICGSTFKFKRTLVKHIQRHDRWGDRSLMCRVCKTLFNFPLKLLKHYRADHPEQYEKERHQNYHCFVCNNADFRDMDIYMLHLSNEHYLKKSTAGRLAGSRYRCPHCGMLFKREADLQRHSIRHSELRKFACPAVDCTRRYKSKPNMLLHLRKRHGIEQGENVPANASKVTSRTQALPPNLN